jgi:hypothetical protein
MINFNALTHAMSTYLDMFESITLDLSELKPDQGKEVVNDIQEMLNQIIEMNCLMQITVKLNPELKAR